MWRHKPNGIYKRGISVGYWDGEERFYAVGSGSIWLLCNFVWFEGPLTFEGVEKADVDEPKPEPKPAGPSLPSIPSLHTLRDGEIAKEEEERKEQFEKKKLETINKIEGAAKRGQQSLYCGYKMGHSDRQRLCDWINEHEGYTARCGEHPYERYSNIIEVWIGKKPPKPKPEPKPVKVASKRSWVPFFLRWD